jgi:hypothetical protein
MWMALRPGVIEAKKEGSTLIGYEIQTTKYSQGMPETLPAPRRPLPFCYQSTGVETRFTNLLEPDAASCNLFAFHRPETLADWLSAEINHPGTTVKARIRQIPPLAEQGLRPAQIKAIKNLEHSLGQSKPRALIQMASGGGLKGLPFQKRWRKSYEKCGCERKTAPHLSSSPSLTSFSYLPEGLGGRFERIHVARGHLQIRHGPTRKQAPAGFRNPACPARRSGCTGAVRGNSRISVHPTIKF